MYLKNFNMFQSETSSYPIEEKLYRNDIDGLRAVAVLAVIFFHTGRFDLLFRGGFVGVDPLLSRAILMTGIILMESRMNKFTLLKFYERRILPMLYFTMAICYIPAYFLMLRGDFSTLSAVSPGLL